MRDHLQTKQVLPDERLASQLVANAIIELDDRQFTPDVLGQVVQTHRLASSPGPPSPTS